MVTGQTGNTRLAGLVFIKAFNGGVDKAEVRHHRLTRAISVPGDNRVQHGKVLCCEL